MEVQKSGEAISLPLKRINSYLHKSKLLKVFFEIFRITLSNFAARKTRDTLAKAIYFHIFNLILSSINQRFVFESELSASILDVAGFGKYIKYFKNITFFIHLSFLKILFQQNKRIKICLLIINSHRMFSIKRIRAIVHQLCK